MEPRVRASIEQFHTLIGFMEKHGDLAKIGTGPQGRLKADRMWQQLAIILNKMHGNSKSIDKWKKVWADWKTKTKKKACHIRLHVRNTGSSKLTLTTLEERVIALMSRTVVAQYKVEEPELESTSDELTTQVLTPQINWEIQDTDVIQIMEIPSPLTNETTPPSVTTPKQQSDPAPPQQSSSTTTRRLRPKMFRRPTYAPNNNQSMRLFMAVEQRRLRLEETRLKELHQREMERLRIESSRILVHSDFVQVLRRLTDIMDTWVNRNVSKNDK
ncbi:uncharacterized protein ACR2FA_004237 [Aphomia sociella]